MTEVPARQDVPQQDKWNAESVFADHAEWQAEYSATMDSIPKLEQFKGTLGDSPDTLVDWFETSSAIRRRVMKLYFYAMMESQCDSLNTKIKGLVGQSQGLFGKFAQATSFASPEILNIDETKLGDWVNEHEGLKLYKHAIFDLLRQKIHVRSEEVEQVLGMLQDPFSTFRGTASELTNADMQFSDATDSNGDKHPLTQSTIEALKSHPDREARRTAWEGYADQYLAFKNTLANTYIASVKHNVFNAKVRGYTTVLEAQLAPSNIPTEVFHNLINTYKKFIPTWHRYWDVRRRALGYDSIHPYDIWAPLTDNPPLLSFEDAVDMVVQGMQPLGKDYVEVMQRGSLEERWVDRYPNKGKRGGAFSFGTYDTYPFIMMSFDGTLGGMSTLAHELGHSMHSWHSRKHQPEVYAGYSMFAAEVASNFNQVLTRAHLFEQHDNRDFQLSLIQEAMDNIHRYFFIMPTLARFEYEVHSAIEDGKPMTPESLNNLMSSLFAEGYGDTMTDDPERTGITWAQFGHLYVPYYTFQYATGISAAHALGNAILAKEKGAVERYIEFLSAGGSDYPINVLGEAGVDMSTPAAVEETFGVLEQLVDRLESLIQ